jgi:hypothetical protein
MSYAVLCKACNYIERHAYHPSSTAENNPKAGQHIEPLVPLTKQGHVPTHCPKCGTRGPDRWPCEATKEDIAKYDAKIARETRAAELCHSPNIEGFFNIPDDFKGSTEIKHALSHLLSGLNGDVLKAAQANVMKVMRSGIAGDNALYVDLYERAVQKAVESAKGAKVAA